MVVAPNGNAFAVRDENGQMRIISAKKDKWLQQIWSENFNLAKNGEDDCLKKDFCEYKTVKFNQQGKVLLNGVKIDMCAGGYFYGKENMRFVPLWNCAEQRAWTTNNAQ